MFFTDDVVVDSQTQRVGVVERTYSDPDTHEPFPAQHEHDEIDCDPSIPPSAYRKFLKTGVVPPETVFLHYTYQATPALVPESRLALLDRSLLIGDIVKKNVNDAMSGVVVNVDVICKLQTLGQVKYKSQHVLQGLVSPDWRVMPQIHLESPKYILNVPSCELQAVESPSEEDVIVYKDWIGRVNAVSYKITLKLTDNCVVEINDHDATHVDDLQDTFSIGDVAITKKGHLRNGVWIFGRYNANTPPVGTVVQLRPLAMEVTWLQKRISSTDDIEPPTILERDEFESSNFHVYDFTKRPTNKSFARTISNADTEIQLGNRVRFKDLSGACVKYGSQLPRIDRTETLGYDINVFDVVSFSTTVTVQWQDLSMSEHRSIDLVPDSSIEDEHAAWPGEVAHTLDGQKVQGLSHVEQPTKVGVIQDVNADDRMARIKWCPNALVQYSVDPDDASGLRSMVTANVGRAEGDTELVSLYDLEAPAALNVRRGDIVLIANKSWSGPSLTRESREWLGEIVDTELDGILVVRLGAAQEVKDVRLKREEVIVAVRSDGTNGLDEADEQMDGAMEAMEEFEREMFSGPREFGLWQGLADDDYDEDDYDEDELDDDTGSWASSDEDAYATYEDENGRPLDEADVVNDDWESEDEDEDDDVDMQDAPAQDTPATTPSFSPRNEGKLSAKTDESSSGVPEDGTPQYLILDGSVPTSHHFAGRPITETAAHMKRVQKEHKVLRASGNLPPGVFVRTWESRLDLFRVLIIGPTETPYQDAPFVIDMYLPSDFPHGPPHAHFYSWTGESGLGGVGRVNPNLYEDGKICLSVLGTWEGSKGEGWSASRSTLLQVLVSLLGLVLVKEPYFNEAGYESLAGLESSRRPSTLYSERAYLRARTFLITALSRLRNETAPKDLEGLEDALRYSYFSPRGPRLLERCVKDVEQVLENSQTGEAEPNGLTVMSKGACIPLRRVLERLKGLL